VFGVQLLEIPGEASAARTRRAAYLEALGFPHLLQRVTSFAAEAKLIKDISPSELDADDIGLKERVYQRWSLLESSLAGRGLLAELRVPSGRVKTPVLFGRFAESFYAEDGEEEVVLVGPGRSATYSIQTPVSVVAYGANRYF
jgi:hypothetical protein